MIIDLILDRKDTEESEGVAIAPCKYSDFYKPITDLYPVEDIPEDCRNGYVWSYDAHTMYHMVRMYEEDFGFEPEISRAMDYGIEDDVRKALCHYIDAQEYNPALKDYINSVNWLDGEEVA